eukprot:182180_1
MSSKYSKQTSSKYSTTTSSKYDSPSTSKYSKTTTSKYSKPTSSKYSSSSSNKYHKIAKSKYYDQDDEKSQGGGMQSVKSGMQSVKSGMQPVKSGMESVKSGMESVKSGMELVSSGMQRCVSGMTLVKVYGRRKDNTMIRIICGIASAVMIVGGATLIFVSGGSSGFMLTAGISMASTGISKAVDCGIQPNFKPLNFVKDVCIAAGITILTFGIGKGIENVVFAETNAVRQQVYDATNKALQFVESAAEQNRAIAGCLLMQNYIDISSKHLNTICENLKTAVSSIISNGKYVIECAVDGNNVDVITLIATNGTTFIPDKMYPEVASIAVDLSLKAKKK